MIVAAQRILQNPLFENPTVLMLVARNELQAQLFANLEAVGASVMSRCGAIQTASARSAGERPA